MSTYRPVRLLLITAAALLASLLVAGCSLHSWSTYQHIPYQRWHKDDAARIAYLSEISRGCSYKARQLARGPGLYHVMMSRRWASKARIAWTAMRLLQASPANPSPRCAKVLSRLRWRIDYQYPCAVGWASSMYLYRYLRASPRQRAYWMRRVRAMGYHCGPHRDWEHYFLRRLYAARSCATGGRAPATPRATQPYTRTPPPGPATTPPPAPGHQPLPRPPPPRKKKRGGASGSF